MGAQRFEASRSCAPWGAFSSSSGCARAFGPYSHALLPLRAVAAGHLYRVTVRYASLRGSSPRSSPCNLRPSLGRKHQGRAATVPHGAGLTVSRFSRVEALERPARPQLVQPGGSRWAARCRARFYRATGRCAYPGGSSSASNSWTIRARSSSSLSCRCNGCVTPRGVPAALGTPCASEMSERPPPDLVAVTRARWPATRHAPEQ
jgi:hypothetical protein